MEYVEHADPAPEPIPIARCRELLGQDGESMTVRPSRTSAGTQRRWLASLSRCTGKSAALPSETCASQTQLPEPANGSTLPIMVGAVIYVRVSTKEQTENRSLPTQLRACEEYCRRQGYEVLDRFHEEGESAKTTDRSQLQNLLTFCRLNKGRVHFVVVST